MQITFDTRNPQDLEILSTLFKNLDVLLQPEQSAQPEVAQNTGTTATGVDLSPEGSGVSGEAVPPSASPAPEKAPRKPRAKKEEVAAAPVEKQGATASSAQTAATEASAGTSAQPSDEAKPLTLDEVRAALQQFTASKGVPAGIELLKKFNAGRISELEEGDYASFVAECAL